MRELKKFLEEEKNKIRYYDKKHEYFFKDLKLISVTTFLNVVDQEEGLEPFNALKIATEIGNNPNSKYYGVEPKKIMSLWSKKANYGTRKHKQVEQVLDEKINDDTLMGFFNKNNIHPHNTINEILVYDVELMLSGRFDLATVEGDEIYIHDVKTSDPLTADKIHHYSKQILIYSILLNRMLKKSGLNFKVKPGKIIHVPPKYDILDERIDFTNLDDFLYPELVDLELTEYDITLVKKLLLKRKNDFKNK